MTSSYFSYWPASGVSAVTEVIARTCEVCPWARTLPASSRIRIANKERSMGLSFDTGQRDTLHELALESNEQNQRGERNQQRRRHRDTLIGNRPRRVNHR